MRRKKILLIDDSQTILTLERLVLRLDYDVTTATDGRTGIARAIEEKPDLVVLDMVMPGMTGDTVCKRLRANEATRAIPIVMVTSRTEPKMVEMGYRSGCSAYLTKPIDGPKLLATIKSCLGDA